MNTVKDVAALLFAALAISLPALLLGSVLCCEPRMYP